MKRVNQCTGFFLIILMPSLLGCASTATKEGTGEYFVSAVREAESILLFGSGEAKGELKNILKKKSLEDVSRLWTQKVP